MNLNTGLVALLSAITFTIAGCTTAPVSQPNQTGAVNAPSVTNPSAAEGETFFSLFKLTDGVSSPVTPDQVEYLELNGKKIMPGNIQIYNEGKELSGDIRFRGAGNYSFNSTAANKDILKVKLISSDETVVPLFKPGKEGFTIQALTNYAFRLVLETDASGRITSVRGVVDTLVDGVVSGDSKTAFEINGGTLTYYQGDTAVTAPLSVIVAQSENLSVKPTTPNDTVAQKVNGNTKKTSVDGYIGVWEKSIDANNKITLNFRKTGSKRFSVSSSVGGKTYSSSGNIPEGESKSESLEVNLSIAGESMSVTLKNPSANVLEVTLKEGGPEDIAMFRNVPLSMDRMLQ